jgi:hypothetical protein
MCVIAVLTVAIAGCGSSDRGNGTLTTSAQASTTAGPVTPEQARLIAKDAYIYGFPIVDNYRVQYAYFIDPKSPEYKGPWNQVHSVARVFTPADTVVQAPNSDTP